MSFSVSWHTLLEELEDLPEGATLLTPLSHDRFRVTDVQEQRVVIEFLDRDIDATQPLQRDQFDTLYRRISEHDGEFDLERLPPDADPYPAVLSLHPRFEVDDNQGVIVEKEAATTTQVIDEDTDDEPAERTEPDFDVYADALLLIDALERHEVDTLEELDTDVLVNLYTLCSDVQRNADSLRKELADVLLTRLHHDRPVSGPFGSVQRTSRRTKSLTDEQEVLETLEAAGVNREQITSVDASKVNDALEVTDVAESDVYEVSKSEYVRKADVDEDSKETRLQGLKDQLAASDDDEAAQLREEVEELEDRIDQLTSFQTGTSYHNQSNPE
jgi:hypothetical protein